MTGSETPGALMVGIAGARLSAAERDMLRHAAVGGVVLFSRNYESRKQLLALTEEIRGIRSPRLLIAIDQEGGRVQRLKKEFTQLPPLGALARLYSSDPARAIEFAYRHGWVMAFEMLSVNIDISFAPVLDLDRGSEVIGDRSMGESPEVVTALGRAYIQGMHDAGMSATGKHFPGHGSVVADSHVSAVTDDRSLEALLATDIGPFAGLASDLDAVMAAHVCYPQVDSCPAGFSSVWLQEVLRDTLGFGGVVFSDDLDMGAARAAGDMGDRITAALDAGCDGVLICDPKSALECVRTVGEACAGRGERLAAMYGRSDNAGLDLSDVDNWSHWRISLEELSSADQERAK